MTKLDYTIQSPEERNEIVKQILAEMDEPPSSKYLEVLADYLVLCMERQERKKHKILTENRLVTVNRNETSFEGIVSQFETGEDAIYDMITEDKQIIMRPKVSITQKDLAEIPFLRQLRDSIHEWEQYLKTAEGKSAYQIKKALIEMRKDQYIIKNAYRRPINAFHLVCGKHYTQLEDTTSTFTEDGLPIPSGISLLNPKVCSFILCNYSRLKQDSWDQLPADLWHIMQDFDNLLTKALADSPMYERLVQLKIDGATNAQIHDILQEEFHETRSVVNLSNLWHNKIPKLIASAAEDEWLDNYYLNLAPGSYKRCGACGQIKLALPKYFSKNKTSKDGYYSICKECRSIKKRR